MAECDALLAGYDAIFEPVELGIRSCNVDEGGRILFSQSSGKSREHALLVMDEAHHLLVTDGAWTEELRSRRELGAACLLLGDESQAESTPAYPPDLTEIRLHEVIRAQGRSAVVWRPLIAAPGSHALGEML